MWFLPGDAILYFSLNNQYQIRMKINKYICTMRGTRGDTITHSIDYQDNFDSR